MIKIINNFLDNDKFWELHKIIFSENFPWFLTNNNNKLVHSLFKDRDGKKEKSMFFTKILSELLLKTDAKEIIYSDVILNFASDEIEIIEEESNLDLNDQSMTGILCMNSCDGIIEIPNSGKYDIVENRFFCFPTNSGYLSSTQTKVPFGILLKMVYKV
tara:strand:- start:1215 stop:1691 length:477 start_codon:yes stop_codon:yes gene_type:complete